MQHQALKYAPSLVNDGRFSQGLSHWFGSFVSHVADGDSVAARCTARSAGSYPTGMPYGISQFIDAPELHRYPAERSASVIKMIPLGTQLAMLLTTENSQLQSRPLAPGTVGVAAPNDVFQHPFRWQDSTGAIAIEPTSRIFLSGGYEGEYRAGQLLVDAPAGSTPQDVVHHRLYIAPEGTIASEVSSAGYGGTRIQVDVDNKQLQFIGPATEVPNLRNYIASQGVTKFIAVLDDQYQVELTTLTQLSNNNQRFSVYYDTFLGAVDPDQVATHTSWDLFTKRDVSCDYTMPLYGYEFTLAYSYQGRKPKPADLTFFQATETDGAFSLNGFGDTALRVLSDTAARMVLPGEGLQPRVVELLRGESRTKVVGRPRLTIPVLDAPELEETSRAVLSLRNGTTFFAEAYVSDAFDPDGRVFNGLRWAEGGAGQSGRLYLAGAYNPDPSHTPNQGLGAVTFSGHLAGQYSNSYLETDPNSVLAKILYGQSEEVVANLFVRGPGPGDNGGEELYVTFQIGGEDIISTSQIGFSGVDASFTAVAANSTLTIRGPYYGTSLTPTYPRIQPGDAVVFDGAPASVEFLNNDQFTVTAINMLGTGALYLEIPSITTEQINGVVSGGLLLETRVSVPVGAGSGDSAFISDVGMWQGNLTHALNLADGSEARDLLSRHTDPLDSLFPKGTVILYAGGGACPAGFKPVQATADAVTPGVPGTQILPPVIASTYDAASDLTTLEFPRGQLPFLRDAAGAPVTIETPTLTSFPAPSLEYGSDLGRRQAAYDNAGNAVYISAVASRYRYAVEPGMTIRVEESSAEGAAPLVAEDRGFLVVGDESAAIPVGQSQASAKRPAYASGANGFPAVVGRDVSILAPGGPSEYYGTGFGTVQYPAVDIGMQTGYDPNGEGFNRTEDQALTNEFNGSLGLEGYLLPKHPTRFSQQTNFKPLGPGIWGQRERFYYETHDQLDPSTQFSEAPNGRLSPSVLLIFNRRYGVQMDIGSATGSSSRPGIPFGETYGYLPNPAWDLSDPGSIDTVAYPPAPVQHRYDLIVDGYSGSLAQDGYLVMYAGMVFFCRIYARCTEFTDGRPTGVINGYFSEPGSSTLGAGEPFLLGTCLLETHGVQSPGSTTNNINIRMYDHTGGEYPDGMLPHVGGGSWPAAIPPGAILQLTPAALYGPAGQPQEYGDVFYTNFDGETATYTGRKVAAPFAQDTFEYTRQESGGSVPVVAQFTASPGTDVNALKVAGDLSGAFAAQPRMFVEPSGYLKYGQTGASMDYGPGRHGHDIARNTELLGTQNLAQPEASQDYLTALPTNHGHGKSGDGRYLTPVANLFTSCIKL